MGVSFSNSEYFAERAESKAFSNLLSTMWCIRKLRAATEIAEGRVTMIEPSGNFINGLSSLALISISCFGKLFLCSGARMKGVKCSLLMPWDINSFSESVTRDIRFFLPGILLGERVFFHLILVGFVPI